MPKLVEIPQDLADLFSDPDRVRAAFELLNALASLQLQIVSPSANIGGKINATRIVGEGELTLPLPIQFRNGWGTPTGTLDRSNFNVATVTTSQLAGRVAALIVDLQSVKIAPGG
jgi:hypothetical protein